MVRRPSRDSATTSGKGTESNDALESVGLGGGRVDKEEATTMSFKSTSSRHERPFSLARNSSLKYTNPSELSNVKTTSVH